MMLRLPLVLALVVVTLALPQFPYSQRGLQGRATNPGVPIYCNIACPRIYIPVCGSDSKTYPNQCVLDYYTCAFRNVTYASSGECGAYDGRDDRPCPVVCPQLYSPVCGSNGVTYPNACTLDAAACKTPSIFLRHNGKCVDIDERPRECPTTCPFDYAPVCGNDGNTYANLCTLLSSACTDSTLRAVKEGPCGAVPAAPSPSCPTNCPGTYEPVCGSDGNTYGNQCTLDLVSCRDPSVTVARRGECGFPFNTCPDVCAEVQDLVCGSDGNTYRNECVFRAATCTDTGTPFSTPGKCDPPPQRPCPVLCPAVYKPVCGTDGRTYANQCVLESDACRLPSLAVASQGECIANASQASPSDTPTRTFTPRPPTRSPFPAPTTSPNTFTLLPPRLFCPNNCGRIFSPVCGSDGKTYYNKCLLDMVGCRERRQLSVAYLGSCIISITVQ